MLQLNKGKQMKKILHRMAIWFLTDVPLIYTSKGNLPLYQLERTQEWIFSLGEIVFKEKYFYGDELVKEGADIYKLPTGSELYIKQGNL